MLDWILSLELTREQAAAFLYTVRIIWTVQATRAAVHSYGEFKKNRKAFIKGKNLGNGKKIVRKGRYRRSRDVFIAFLIAWLVGVGATTQTFILTPQVQTSIYSSVLTILLIIMFECFYKAMKSDIQMREEARNYKERSVDDPSAIHERMGEEMAGAPEEES